MMRFIGRAAALGAAVLGSVCLAQPASATTFTFDVNSYDSNGVQSANSALGQSLFYRSTDGSGINLNIYGGHFSDPSASGFMSTSGATVAAYGGGYGLGVLYGTDNASNGTHQLDNYGGGADFVVLQFSQAVTLDSIGRHVYPLANIRPSDDDASFEAYAGSLASLTSGLNTSGFTDLPGNGVAGETSTGSAKSSSIWLVSAYVNSTAHDDGFKIYDLKVSAPSVGAVPEPATWAMMIVGMGVIGSTMRRRKPEGTVGVIA